MADTVTAQSNTLATIPASTVIATDDAGASGHVQIVKLALSADGSAAPITADSNGLEVQGAGTAGSAAGGVMSVQGVASGTVLPVSAASLPLPSGASTLAEQQSQTTHLATIAGDTTDIETAVELLDDTVATTGSAIPTKGLAVSGTDGTNARVLKTDSGGELQIDVLSIAAGTNNIGDVDVLSIAAGDNNIGNVDIVTVPAPLSTTGGGTEATALRVTLATDSTGVLSVDDNGGALTVDNAGTFAVQVDGNALTALQLIDDSVLQDDNAFTPGTTKVMMAGYEADESSTDSVDEGDGGAARMTLDRKVIVTPQPHTQGGLSIFRSLDLDETEEDVKTAAGQVYGGWVTNTATTTRWLKFYNATAANVTVGSTTPVITIGIPGNTSDDIGAVLGNGGMGIAFDTAICVAVTTGLADNDTGAPAANDFVCNIFYK